MDADVYVFACARYSELNPVRAAMVPTPGAYHWSSDRWHADGNPNPVVTDYPLYQAWGATPDERQAAYQGFFQDVFDEQVLQDMRTTVHQSRVLGTKRLQDAIEAA